MNERGESVWTEENTVKARELGKRTWTEDELRAIIRREISEAMNAMLSQIVADTRKR